METKSDTPRLVEPVGQLAGHIAVPGDKSISHRSVLIAALCDGETRISGFGRSADTEATIGAVKACGAWVYEHDVDTLRVGGVGLRGLRAPAAPIDCANAGTLMRLFTGVLAGQEGTFTLAGDESLSKRPMERVAEPLRRMGAAIEATDGHAPLRIEGRPLQPITYELPVASAQVKSAVLFAGLLAHGGETTVVEPQPTRDHTEAMLEAAGARITRRAQSVTIWPGERLELGEIEVPGDFSSAAPFIVAALLVPGSEVHVHGVNLNPRRTGLLTILARMGAKVTVYNRRRIAGEPAGDLEVRASELVATEVGADEVPDAIDELPLFALAATCAHGDSVLRGAAELRAKESDRIEATADALRAVGGHVRATADGLRIRGVPTRLRGGIVESRGDHRIAMLGAVAGVASGQGVQIRDADAVAVSFPGFFDLLSRLEKPSTDS
jgi:3-phosphoshikimate 1-carboxyvinyltransferase